MSGSNTVSPSIMMMISCLAARMPAFSALGLPEFFCRSTRTFGMPQRLHLLGGAVGGAVVDDQHFQGWSLATMDRTVASMFLISL